MAALERCRLLVIPSPYESLSVITLEAWKLGVPVLANARCKVLVGQCLRSNGGLFYHGYAEFAEALRLLLERPGLRARLGPPGKPTSSASTPGTRSTRRWRTSSLGRGRSRALEPRPLGVSPCR